MHQSLAEIDPSGYSALELTVIIVNLTMWTLTYGIWIVKAHKDKQYSVPFIAAAVMWSYEFCFIFIWPVDIEYWKYLEYAWFTFDSILLIQIALYGGNSWRNRLFVDNPELSVILGTGVCLWGVWALVDWTGMYDGVVPAIFALTVVSTLFPFFVINRYLLRLHPYDGISYPALVTRALADMTTCVSTWLVFKMIASDARPQDFIVDPETGIQFALVTFSPNNPYTLFLLILMVACDVGLLYMLPRTKPAKGPPMPGLALEDAMRRDAAGG